MYRREDRYQLICLNTLASFTFRLTCASRPEKLSCTMQHCPVRCRCILDMAHLPRAASCSLNDAPKG